MSFGLIGNVQVSAPKTMRKYHGEKKLGEKWVRMSEFVDISDDKKMQRHAEAFGGEFRVCHGERVALQWVDGQPIPPV